MFKIYIGPVLYWTKFVFLLCNLSKLSWKCIMEGSDRDILDKSCKKNYEFTEIFALSKISTNVKDIFGLEECRVLGAFNPETLPFIDFWWGEDFNEFVVLLHHLFNMSRSFPSMVHFQDTLNKVCNKTTNSLKSSPHQKSVLTNKWKGLWIGCCCCWLPNIAWIHIIFVTSAANHTAQQRAIDTSMIYLDIYDRCFLTTTIVFPGLIDCPT